MDPPQSEPVTLELEVRGSLDGKCVFLLGSACDVLKKVPSQCTWIDPVFTLRLRKAYWAHPTLGKSFSLFLKIFAFIA